MSPSPAGVDWSAECPVDLSLTNRPTHLPPHFRPPGFCAWALSFFTAFIVSLGDFQSARMPAYVCVCALSYDFVCVCLYVCLYACQAERSCVKMTVWDSWGPRTQHRWRGEIRYFSPPVFFTHIYSPLSPPCPTCSQTTGSHRHTGIHSVQCPVIPSETEHKAQTCVSPLY